MATGGKATERGEEKVFGKDTRERIKPNRDRSGHTIHSSIYQVRAACGDCKDVEPGTCFMLKDMNDDCEKFFYFATAAHVICCDRNGAKHSKPKYRDVQLVHSWEPNSAEPTQTFPPLDTKEFIEENKVWGWLSVPGEYKRKYAEADTEDGRRVVARQKFPHDFGVIAVRRDKLNAAYDTWSAEIKNATMPSAARSSEPFFAKAYLCGYPGEKEKQNVRGHMYWVSAPKEAPDTLSLTEGVKLTKNQSDEERKTDAVFPMPQYHINADGDGKEDDPGPGTSVEARNRLYRHYIDSSGGQSGAPVYVESSSPNGDFDVIGIHVGTWFYKDVSDKYLCNIAVRVSEIISTMTAWVAKNMDKTPVEAKQHSGTERYTEKLDEPLLFHESLPIHGEDEDGDVAGGADGGKPPAQKP